ncbi:MAG: peroxiredoxin [Gemmatimonadetes bacterium]|nr:peroxiredoxin [Gemmatimonadota bacterium]
MRLHALLIPALGALLAAAPGVAQAAPDSAIGRPTAVLVDGPRVGDRASDFSLPWASRDGVVTTEPWFSLSAQRGRVVVLAFFPRAFTPGCTAEMRTFAEQYSELFGDDVVVVGISADSLETQQRFAASLGLPFRLLADQDQRVARAYGSAADRPGYNRRTVYVLNRKGEVSYTDLRFRALEPDSYRDLGRAVADARQGR